MGRAIAAATVVGIVTIVATVTANRFPMWAGFLGVVTLLGSYETTFAATPTSFVSDSMTAVTTSLLAGALGFLVAVLATAPGAAPAPVVEHAVEVEAALPAPRDAADSNVTISEQAAR
jgi:hypothetical protein